MDTQQIGMMLLSAGLGVIGYLLLDLKNSIKEKIKENSDAIKETHEELTTLKTVLPCNYVMRDDFLRAISNLDVKFDKVAGEVSDINKNLNKLLGGEKN